MASSEIIDDKKAAKIRKKRLTYARQYYRANRETMRAKSRAWRKNNTARHRAYAKAYRTANPEKVRESQRKWRSRNRAKLRRYHREHQRKWRAANIVKERERGRDYMRQWRRTNREKFLATQRAYRAANRKRLLKKRRKAYAANPESARASSRKRYYALVAAMRAAKGHRRRGRKSGMTEETKVIITVAAGLKLEGQTKYKMAPRLFARQADAYNSTKQFFRRYSHEIKSEMDRLNALGQQQKEVCVKEALNRIG